jgi:hypothetical protein
MKTWGKSESVGENVREKYLSIQIVFSNFAGCMEKTNREYLVHSISDNIPYVNKEQDL